MKTIHFEEMPQWMAQLDKTIKNKSYENNSF